MDSSIRIDRHMETVRFREPVCRCLVALLFLTTLLVAFTARAAQARLKFDLPAGEFTTAILEFYRQSRIEVIFAAADSLRDVKTQAVIGEFEPAEALNRMLKGTPLVAEFDTPDSVIIRQKAQTAGTSEETTPPAPSAHHMAALEPTVGHNLKLEEVVVTGSLIHGVMDVMAPVIYVTRKDLARASYATVQDALYALPINSLNGPREDLGLNNNYNYGSGVNLRALGVGATLVLVNGHRQPLSGLNADFVDVSNIPWSAVERIEVLPDGASAISGSDAIAGVVNIILRDDIQGAETQARFGGAPGGRDEAVVSQLVGTHWDNGKAMLVYQYSDATALAAADRGYAADTNKTPLGGGDYRTFYSNPGNILDPRTYQPVFGIPTGQNGTQLTPAALSSTINLENRFADYELFPERRSHSLYATASQAVGAGVELFVEGRFTRRDTLERQLPQNQFLTVPRSNAFFVDPFGGSQDVTVAYSFLRDLGPTVFAAHTQNIMGTAGARFRIGDGWQATLSESYGREILHNSEYNVPDPAALNAALADPNPATAFNPFGDGSHTNPATLQAINRDYLLHAASAIQTTSAIADGSVLSLPSGEAKLAIGIEHRKETLEHDVPDPSDPAERSVSAAYGRHISSAFSELSLPLMGNPADPLAAPRLELTLAGRVEHYSDFGTTLDPTARLRWIPFQSLKLRASWGRSFRAPKLDDLYDSSQNFAGLVLYADPQAASGRSIVLVRQGDNPSLRQETARTWTTGIDFAPAQVPGLNLSLTYYSIDYEGRISQPGSDDPSNILAHGNEWAAFIIRNPTPAQIAAVCNSPEFFGSRSACLDSSPAAIIDARLANLASTRVSGLDFEGKQSLDSDVGSFGFGVNGSYVLHFDQAATKTSPSEDIVDTVGNPLALRLRATAEWNRHRPDQPGAGLRLALNYTGGYRNPGSSLDPQVAAWTTVDLQLHYRTRQTQGLWANTEFSLNAINAFNKDPPFVDGQFGYDVYNAQSLGRVISAFVSKRW
jgi:iron complex outermembrane receptor protein